MKGLRVLITNWTLLGRSGSVMYVRDLALELLRQGHSPVVYSTQLGHVATELRGATVPVVDSLDVISSQPDIIHGNHHPETMEALLRFPTTPAIHVCHAWDSWEAAPPRFPRIRRYVAVDHTCKDWLVSVHGIAEHCIRVIFNSVDLGRFRPRSPLPDRPSRALVFSNYASEDTYVRVVQEACARSGLTLDVLGDASGKSCDRPELVLGNYDLVFAKARCAMEAMAVGTAVLLCDHMGAGPMVDASNFEELRRLNFGRRALQRGIEPGFLAEEISKYDAVGALAVSQRLRSDARLEQKTRQLIDLYLEVIEEHAIAARPELEVEQRAAATYLHWLIPYAQSFSRLHSVESECRRLREECDRLRANY